MDELLESILTMEKKIKQDTKSLDDLRREWLESKGWTFEAGLYNKAPRYNCSSEIAISRERQ